MRRYRDEAYVLGTRALGEADLIVTLLAEHHGRVRGVASHARKSRRRFGGALEPMTRATASWVEREGRELHRIESLEVLRSYATMQSDPARQAAVAVLCEITEAIVHEAQPEGATFRLVGALLDALEGGLDPWLAVRYAEYWTLKLHGVLPDLSTCEACGTPLAEGEPRYAVKGAGVLCRRCPKPQGAVLLQPADVAVLASFDRTAPAELRLGADSARPAGALDTLLRGTLETFAERSFRTYRHLRHATGGPTR